MVTYNIMKYLFKECGLGDNAGSPKYTARHSNMVIMNGGGMPLTCMHIVNEQSVYWMDKISHTLGQVPKKRTILWANERDG